MCEIKNERFRWEETLRKLCRYATIEDNMISSQSSRVEVSSGLIPSVVSSTSHRENRLIIRHAGVEPTASLVTVQTHPEPSQQAFVSSRVIVKSLAEGHLPHVLPLMAGLPGANFQQDNTRPLIAKMSQVCLHPLPPFSGLLDRQICHQSSITGIIWNGKLYSLRVWSNKRRVSSNRRTRCLRTSYGTCMP
ncbi:hypothetical protein TNCV_68121 [Trichonephila clavipes]|nr:hypothetical protein TNCV_68121 [Trichonephila clavipes]